ncbi:hypothetical protein BCR43DRAFT_219780 [Syncephalastrum racemosum]|uniref:Uncharacterized protein n=1 Tax=Syncephalastrum racemosum TaxID=13706 RepID=A0A1X2HJB2_SYNRA|nr:hypothetical protein BCR43DRAFT_219780 [Syncephalastrum racemosum]
MSESSFHSSTSSSWIKSTSMNNLVNPSMSTSTASSTSERWRHSAQRRQQSQQERMRQLQDLEQQVADAATWNKRRTDLVTPPQQRARHLEDAKERFLDSPPAERDPRKSIDLRDASLEDLESLIAASAKRLANHRLKRMSELGRPLTEHGNGISDLLDADDADIRRTDKRQVFMDDPPPQPSLSKRSSSTHHKNVLERFDPLNAAADERLGKTTAASQAPMLIPAQSHLRSMGEAKERRRPSHLNVDLLHSSSSPQQNQAQPVHSDSSPKTPTRLPTPRTNSSSALPRFSLPAGPSASSTTSSRRMRTFSSVSKETELWMASKGKPSYSSTRLVDSQRTQLPRTPTREEPSFASSTASSLRKSTSGMNVASRPTRTRTVSLMSASTPMHPKARKEVAEFDPLVETPKRTAPRARVVSMTTGAAKEHTPLDLSSIRRTRMSQSNLKPKAATNANANGSGSGPRESQSMSTASSSSGRKRGKVRKKKKREKNRQREKERDIKRRR